MLFRSIDVAQYGKWNGTHHDLGLAGCAFLKMERVSSTFFLYRLDGLSVFDLVAEFLREFVYDLLIAAHYLI